MDYGRTIPPTDTPEFFTSGAGTNDENVNNFEANNNLDLNELMDNAALEKAIDNRLKELQ